MRRHSSLPLILSLAAGGVALGACGSEVVQQSGPATGSGASGGVGGNGSSSSGTANGGAGGASSTGTSASGGGQACGVRPGVVMGCVDLDAPVNATLSLSGALVDSGTPAPGCLGDPGSAPLRVPAWGPMMSPDEVVWLTIADPSGPVTLGLQIPGLTPKAFVPGDMIDVQAMSIPDEFGATAGSIVVMRNGAPVAAVAENLKLSLPLSLGEETCYQEDGLCGVGERDLVWDATGQPIGKGVTEVVEGNLAVTNDHVFELYDLGACNFIEPIDYVFGLTDL